MGLLLSVASLSGCGRDVPDTVETLEVYCVDAGYGSEWCQVLLDLFGEQEWVQEKYPNLQILPLRHNDVATYAANRIDSGANSNTIDLFFGTFLHSYAGTRTDGGELIVDLTDSVYNAQVPGEDILYKDKMLDSYYESNRYVDPLNPSAEDKFYYTSWAGGMNGIIYNEEILEQFGCDVPNTTDELLEICALVMANEGLDNGRYNGGFSFMYSAKDTDYISDYLLPVWWAQYEGADGYRNFWNGLSENRCSVNIFRQMGRLYSLEAFADLVNYDTGYVTRSAATYGYMESQTLMLRGNGVFHVNGDWFDIEMQSIREQIEAEGGDQYTLKMMRTPVISAIVEKTPSITEAAETAGITADEMLSNVIDAVDAGEDGYTGIDPDDYQTIRKARSIIHTAGPNHTAVIPSYAAGKDVAVDFLRFMATDIALEAYMRTTLGAGLPFEYDVKTKNPELYASFSAIEQSRVDYFSDPNLEITILPSENAFPLARYGGVDMFINDRYFSTFGVSGNTVTPQDFYDQTWESWNEPGRWENACSQAGLPI